MTKSNVTVAEIPVLNSSGGGLGYYCAGRHCTVKDKCHRYTSGVAQQNAVFDEYDTLMLSEKERTCKYFVNVKKANQIGD
jgi:hypothetical protein